MASSLSARDSFSASSASLPRSLVHGGGIVDALEQGGTDIGIAAGAGLADLLGQGQLVALALELHRVGGQAEGVEALIEHDHADVVAIVGQRGQEQVDRVIAQALGVCRGAVLRGEGSTAVDHQHHVHPHRFVGGGGVGAAGVQPGDDEGQQQEGYDHPLPNG